MQTSFSAGMAEATAMTRAGRLADATALIQRLLGGTTAPADASAAPDVLLPEPDPQTGPQAGPKPQARMSLRATLRRLAERARALDIETAEPLAPDVDGARFERRTHASHLGARDYWLYVPANLPAGPRPLVVMLHGCTQSPQDFARGTGMNALAEEFGLLVAYPGQPDTANPKRCWNWFRPEDQRRDAGEPGLIAGIVREILAREPADAARVFVAGLSAGGATAAILAAEYPEIFAAAGVHSGLAAGAARDLPSALAAMRQGPAAPARSRIAVPLIVFHGDADRIVNPRNAEALEAQAQSPDCRTQSRIEDVANGRSFTRRVRADAQGRIVSEHWTLHGAGHAWSGGDAKGSYTDPGGPSASREMLRFFRTVRP